MNMNSCVSVKIIMTRLDENISESRWDDGGKVEEEERDICLDFLLTDQARRTGVG